VLVTRPKLLELKFVTGLLNWGVFVMLKASARNSKPTRSLMGNLRNSDASKSNSPGPLNAMRGAVPKALSGPLAKSLVSNQDVAIWCSILKVPLKLGTC